jgi:hypothetical protein
VHAAQHPQRQRIAAGFVEVAVQYGDGWPAGTEVFDRADEQAGVELAAERRAC